MTPHDDVQDRMARLAQRQDQLERQQRDTNRGVEVLRRDADSGIENLRWNTDLRLKDMEWNADLRLKDLEQRVASLERFRDFVESLIMHAIMIGCGVALTILIVIIVVEARGGRQENGQLEERSLISLRVAPGDQVQPGLSPAAQIPPPRHWATSKLVADELGSFTESLSPKRAGLKDERILGLAYPLVRVHYGGAGRGWGRAVPAPLENLPRLLAWPWHGRPSLNCGVWANPPCVALRYTPAVYGL